MVDWKISIWPTGKEPCPGQTRSIPQSPLDLKSSKMPKPRNKYQCPCCDYFTLPGRGGFTICPVCFWEDEIDDTGFSGFDIPEYLDRISSANSSLTLRQARANFLKLGACEARMIPHVFNESERNKLRLARRDLNGKLLQ